MFPLDLWHIGPQEGLVGLVVVHRLEEHNCCCTIFDTANTHGSPTSQGDSSVKRFIFQFKEGIVLEFSCRRQRLGDWLGDKE